MSRDLRRYASQTNRRLLLGFFLLLIVVGGGLIYYFYGRNAAGFGLLCIILGLAPALLAWIALAVMGWVARKIDDQG